MQTGWMDIHTHILPGVDDGARNMDESLQMITMAYEKGVRVMIATPHYYPNNTWSKEKLEHIFEQLEGQVKEIHKDMKLYLGHEIFFHEGCIEAIKKGKAMSLANSKYVLIEFNYDERFSVIYKGMKDLIQAGFIPIIAHVERYVKLMEKESYLQALIDLGCYLQGNVRSFIGSSWNLRTRRFRKLFDKGLIHFIASDCHDVRIRPPHLGTLLHDISKHVEEKVLYQVAIKNPECIIKNQYF